VNDELGEIRSLLKSAPSLLKFGGRLAVISFHSLEDRLAKDAFKDGAQHGIWELVTRKPVIATDEETDRNPRSRSAKLRVAERIKGGPQVTRKIPPQGGSTRGHRF
jgi:16S rRNA (cytosine1402-N4)-methyltransferase